MSKIYTGIGSRNTPKEVLELMKTIGKYLSRLGYELRSGGANGADMAFEIGCDKVDGKKSIYLPWYKFNNNTSNLYNISKEALKIAEKYHPYWHNLKQGGRKLMGRNSYQVLGLDLETPTDFILCYTKGGKGSGGTGQALRIAKDYNIPIFDFGKYDTIDEMKTNFCDFFNEFK